MAEQSPSENQPLSSPVLAGLPSAGSWLVDHGLILDEVSGTRVTAHMELGARHLTPWGVVHGGVYTTAAESLASIGASVAVRDRGEFAVPAGRGDREAHAVNT